MVRNLKLYVLMFCALFTTTSAFTACSDDDPVIEEQSEDNKEDNDTDNDKEDNDSTGNIPGISDEMMAKIQQIYDNASTGPQEVTTVNQLAVLTSICASIEADGPITVTHAALNGRDVTLVTLGGTEDKEGQATTMQESQLAAFGKTNDYLKALSSLFESGVIPRENPVIVTGISLGGMIAQQLLGEQDILDKFTIEAVITFGSPLTLPLDRHNVKVVRFADMNDKVPQLGEMIIRNGMATGNSISKEELTAKLNELDTNERITRTSKYRGMIETHALSYIEDECWSDIDFMGSSDKDNTLVLKENMKFYPAPKLSK